MPEFEPDNNKEYEVETIRDSVVYARESESGHLPGLYYLVSWKRYLEEENTWEPASAVQHLRKLISLFHKDHPDRPTATSPAIDIAPLMARLTVRPTKPLKRKRGQPTGCTMKCTKTRSKACLVRQQRRGDKEEVIRRNPSPLSSKSLIIQVPYHLSSLSSKSFTDQITFFLSPPLSVFPSLFLVRVGRFFH